MNVDHPTVRAFPDRPPTSLFDIRRWTFGVQVVLALIAAASPIFADDFQPVPRSELPALWEFFATTQRGVTNFATTVTQTKTLKVFQQPIVSEAKLWFNRPNQFRWEVVKPAPSLTISDGKWLWMYYPEFQQAERYLVNDPRLGSSPLKALSAGLGANPASLTNSCDVTVLTNDRFYRLDVVPRDAKERQFLSRLVLDFNRTTLFLARTVMESPNGDRTENQYGPARVNESVDAALFHFDPPSGAKVVSPFSK